jgi:PAS domain S-box-containing protein
MRLALAAGGALLLALLTWLLLSGINTNASAYAETQRAFDDFALAEASIGRDVLQARAGLLGNYDVLAEAEEAMESAASRIRLHVEAENLDPKPVEALVAAVGQYEGLIERFKTGNSLLQNSLSYVGQLSTDPAFGALGDQFAPSATALAAAVLRLAGDSSPESAKSLQQHINRFEAQAPTGGLEGEAAHALLAHARLLSDLLPEVDQTLRALVAAPSRQPFEETRELLARSQAAFEVTAQRFRVLLYVVSLGLLVIALRLGQRLWTRTLRIRRLVDANIIGIFIWDLDGRIIEANDAFLRMVGYDHEDIVSGGMRWTELTPPEWLDRDERGWLPQLKATGILQPFEKEYFRKDDSRVPVLIGVATFEGGGNQGVAFVLDLTERKCAEEALRESEAKFRDYAETTSDWFWEIGPDYKFTLLTENAFGSDAADRIGTVCWEHALDLETEPEKWRLVRATLDSRKPFRDFVYCSAGRNGSPMYVKASGKPVFDANGEFRGYRGTGTDVTALMRAQEEHERLRQLESDLAHMNRLSMMGELAASLAHEVTQPIATARNNARAALNFLDKQPPDLGDVREALACVVGDADRAGAIIDRIRDHIKKVPPRRHRFDLNEAINEVIGLARSAIIRNGVSVQTRLTEGLAPVQGDRVQLQQVVLNLILNAVDAMSTVEAEPRDLLISTEQTQTGGVLVSVRDSGPGIDPTRLEQVFEAFYTTKSSGVGMGLSICRSIIDAHGGRLWAEANEPRGAVFQFTLPRADRQLTNSFRPAQLTRELHEDTVSDTAHQPAYEGNKRPHRSRREPDQRHWGSQ